MPYSDGQDQVEPAPADRPPRLATIVVAAGIAAFMTTALALKARWRFSHPPAVWMTDFPEWYDHVLGALAWASAAGACGVYLQYRMSIRRAGMSAVARPWQHRREVRFVLYVVAGVSWLQLPLGVYRYLDARFAPPSPPLAQPHPPEFPLSAVCFPPIGVALMVYDRRRIIRDQQSGTLCRVCGYDLRASAERCPECGTAMPTADWPLAGTEPRTTARPAGGRSKRRSAMYL